MYSFNNIDRLIFARIATPRKNSDPIPFSNFQRRWGGGDYARWIQFSLDRRLASEWERLFARTKRVLSREIQSPAKEFAERGGE